MVVMQNEAKKLECPDERVLTDYVSGQLEEPQLGQCEVHLAKCDRCEETIREIFNGNNTANDSFDQLALEALRNGNDGESADAPLVDQLIRDLAKQSFDPDVAIRALENRAAEVNRLLPVSDHEGAIGRVGGYEIKRLLGAGSTGIVYEADDESLHRKVALKILRPSLGEAARDRFINEARAAAAISHSNVITIYQVGVEGPLAFIAMELSEGRTLESRLNGVTFIQENEVRQIGMQVAQGLAAAHRNGLIHRDIKPANVWLKSENDQAVILDFGLARIADDDPQMTATGMLAGTPNFMSPEQTRGLELDGRSDLFSLGCLMYRASTGKLPFGSTGILATLQSIQHDQPRAPKLLNPHLSDDFSDLVMALLEKQPANRPETVDQLVKALQTERSQWPFPVASYGEADGASDACAITSTDLANPSGFDNWRWVTAALLLIGFGTLGWFFGTQVIRLATDHGELVIDAKDKAVKVEVLNGGQLVRVIDTKTDRSIDIESGEYDLRLKESTNGLRLSSNRVVLTRGDQEIVTIIGSVEDGTVAKDNTGFDPEKVKAVQLQNNLKQVTRGADARIGQNSRYGVTDSRPQVDMNMGMPRRNQPPAESLYAGRTFDQWMQVVKNDRQLKTKFDALAAVAELAQGDDDREKQAMDQIKPLLRKYGSRTMGGGDPFQQELTGGSVKNTFRNDELTHLFIEILRRFSADDLMQLAVDEIKNGTANSREFLMWLWLPGSIRENDPQRQAEYFRVINEHAVEIATAALDTAARSDLTDRQPLIGAIAQVARIVGLDWDSNEDPLNQFFSKQQPRRLATKMPSKWRALLNEAFESDEPMKRGLVAIAMVRTFPNRPNLAMDLAELLADEQVLPELRAAGLVALEELLPEQIEPVASRLIAVGKQRGPAKDRLAALTKKHSWIAIGNSFSHAVHADVRIALLLSKLDEPPQELLSWLKDLQAKADADPGQPTYGGPDPAFGNTKRLIADAIKAVEEKQSNEN